MRSWSFTCSAILLMLLAIPAVAKPPRAELAGIKLGMSEETAHESLEKRGTKQSEKEKEGERDEQESWQLKRGPWGYVAFGVASGRVGWVTAFAREDGPRIRYADIGSLAGSHRSGTYYVKWKVPATGRARAYTVIARGRDSIYVASVSILNDDSRRPADPDDPR